MFLADRARDTVDRQVYQAKYNYMTKISSTTLHNLHILPEMGTCPWTYDQQLDISKLESAVLFWRSGQKRPWAWALWRRL
jgi:hypothetical protein